MDGPLEPPDAPVVLRVPRWQVALALALLLHGATAWVAHLLPKPKPREQRVELTVQHARPPPPAADSPAPPQSAPGRRKPRPTRVASTPVAPVLPPSEAPPPERAQLPVAPVDPEPAPPPPPAAENWKDRLMAQLSASSPRPRAPAGVLAPSFASLQRVAFADPRLHDEETEQRIMEDFGTFFRRGLEALRGNWHPGEVLNAIRGDPTRDCGVRTRTTYAVAVLDKQGHVVDVDLKSGSGCPDLDREAVAAFKRVAQFPFPPAGIFIGPDGTPLETARYPVRFIVTFDGGLRLDWR